MFLTLKPWLFVAISATTYLMADLVHGHTHHNKSEKRSFNIKLYRMRPQKVHTLLFVKTIKNAKFPFEQSAKYIDKWDRRSKLGKERQATVRSAISMNGLFRRNDLAKGQNMLDANNIADTLLSKKCPVGTTVREKQVTLDMKDPKCKDTMSLQGIFKDVLQKEIVDNRIFVPAVNHNVDFIIMNEETGDITFKASEKEKFALVKDSKLQASNSKLSITFNRNDQFHFKPLSISDYGTVRFGATNIEYSLTKAKGQEVGTYIFETGGKILKIGDITKAFTGKDGNPAIDNVSIEKIVSSGVIDADGMSHFLFKGRTTDDPTFGTAPVHIIAQTGNDESKDNIPSDISVAVIIEVNGKGAAALMKSLNKGRKEDSNTFDFDLNKLSKKEELNGVNVVAEDFDFNEIDFIKFSKKEKIFIEYSTNKFKPRSPEVLPIVKEASPTGFISQGLKVKVPVSIKAIAKAKGVPFDPSAKDTSYVNVFFLGDVVLCTLSDEYRDCPEEEKVGEITDKPDKADKNCPLCPTNPPCPSPTVNPQCPPCPTNPPCTPCPINPSCTPCPTNPSCTPFPTNPSCPPCPTNSPCLSSPVNHQCPPCPQSPHCSPCLQNPQCPSCPQTPLCPQHPMNDTSTKRSSPNWALNRKAVVNLIMMAGILMPKMNRNTQVEMFPSKPKVLLTRFEVNLKTRNQVVSLQSENPFSIGKDILTIDEAVFTLKKNQDGWNFEMVGRKNVGGEAGVLKVVLTELKDDIFTLKGTIAKITSTDLVEELKVQVDVNNMGPFAKIRSIVPGLNFELENVTMTSEFIEATKTKFNKFKVSGNIDLPALEGDPDDDCPSSNMTTQFEAIVQDGVMDVGIVIQNAYFNKVNAALFEGKTMKMLPETPLLENVDIVILMQNNLAEKESKWCHEQIKKAAEGTDGEKKKGLQFSIQTEIPSSCKDQEPICSFCLKYFGANLKLILNGHVTPEEISVQSGVQIDFKLHPKLRMTHPIVALSVKFSAIPDAESSTPGVTPSGFRALYAGADSSVPPPPPPPPPPELRATADAPPPVPVASHSPSNLAPSDPVLTAAFWGINDTTLIKAVVRSPFSEPDIPLNPTPGGGSDVSLPDSRFEIIGTTFYEFIPKPNMNVMKMADKYSKAGVPRPQGLPADPWYSPAPPAHLLGRIGVSESGGLELSMNSFGKDIYPFSTTQSLVFRDYTLEVGFDENVRVLPNFRISGTVLLGKTGRAINMQFEGSGDTDKNTFDFSSEAESGHILYPLQSFLWAYGSDQRLPKLVAQSRFINGYTITGSFPADGEEKEKIPVGLTFTGAVKILGFKLRCAQLKVDLNDYFKLEAKFPIAMPLSKHDILLWNMVTSRLYIMNKFGPFLYLFYSSEKKKFFLGLSSKVTAFHSTLNVGANFEIADGSMKMAKVRTSFYGIDDVEVELQTTKFDPDIRDAHWKVEACMTDFKRLEKQVCEYIEEYLKNPDKTSLNIEDEFKNDEIYQKSKDKFQLIDMIELKLKRLEEEAKRLERRHILPQQCNLDCGKGRKKSVKDLAMVDCAGFMKCLKIVTREITDPECIARCKQEVVDKKNEMKKTSEDIKQMSNDLSNLKDPEQLGIRLKDILHLQDLHTKFEATINCVNMKMNALHSKLKLEIGEVGRVCDIFSITRLCFEGHVRMSTLSDKFFVFGNLKKNKKEYVLEVSLNLKPKCDRKMIARKVGLDAFPLVQRMTNLHSFYRRERARFIRNITLAVENDDAQFVDASSDAEPIYRSRLAKAYNSLVTDNIDVRDDATMRMFREVYDPNKELLRVTEYENATDTRSLEPFTLKNDLKTAFKNNSNDERAQCRRAKQVLNLYQDVYKMLSHVSRRNEDAREEFKRFLKDTKDEYDSFEQSTLERARANNYSQDRVDDVMFFSNQLKQGLKNWQAKLKRNYDIIDKESFRTWKEGMLDYFNGLDVEPVRFVKAMETLLTETSSREQIPAAENKVIEGLSIASQKLSELLESADGTRFSHKTDTIKSLGKYVGNLAGLNDGLSCGEASITKHRNEI